LPENYEKMLKRTLHHNFRSKAELPEMSHQDATTLCGERWKEVSEEEKAELSASYNEVTERSMPRSAVL